MDKKYCDMPFGKYKGQNITELPSSYIAWLLANNIPKGRLREDLRSYIWDIEKNSYIEAVVNEWVHNNLEVSKSKKTDFKNTVTFDNFDDYMWDAMDGCLPNQ